MLKEIDNLTEDNKINQQFAVTLLRLACHLFDVADNGYRAVDAMRRRYRAFREMHGDKPWNYYRGRGHWSPLPAEFARRG